jgi:hypothetical protein
MDPRAHQTVEGGIDHPVPRDPGFPLESPGDDGELVMAAAGLRAGVTDMLAALVVELDDLRLQCGKPLPDHSGRVGLEVRNRGGRTHAGKPRLKGLTVTRANTRWVM